jgi:hypothetical protein
MLIAAHKDKLLAKRPTVAPVWVHELKPGLHVVNGEQVFATDRELNYLDQNGAVIKTTPNGRQAFQVIGAPLTLHNLARAYGEHFDVIEGITRPTVATKGTDDALIELYLKERNITGAQEKQARETWTLFRELCPGVKLKDATRDDGRKLVAHLKAKGNKSTTVMHKIAQLCAAVNFAIAEGKLRFNPFSGIACGEDEQLIQCGSMPCRRQILGELARIHINTPDGSAIRAPFLLPLRKEIEPFIIGVGKVRTEDTPEGIVVIKCDDR